MEPTNRSASARSRGRSMRRRGLAAVALLMLLGAPPAAQGSPVETLTPTDLADVAQPRVDDPISEAELEDLKFLASQEGVTLEAAIDRYAWNDNFALAVATIREAAPEAFTGAQVVDGEGAWVAFAASAPDEAVRIVEAFEKAHSAVAVDVRHDFGFTEVDLEIAIEAVHYAVLEAANVRDVTTSFDFDTRQITTVVAVGGGMTDAALDELRAAATDALVDAGLARILDSIAVRVVQSNLPALGGSDDNNAHIGGEGITTCTTGFVVKNAAGVRGVGTAGHCQNAQSE